MLHNFLSLDNSEPGQRPPTFGEVAAQQKDKGINMLEFRGLVLAGCMSSARQ